MVKAHIDTPAHLGKVDLVGHLDVKEEYPLEGLHAFLVPGVYGHFTAARLAQHSGGQLVGSGGYLPDEGGRQGLGNPIPYLRYSG